MRIAKSVGTFVVLLVGCAALRSTTPDKAPEPCVASGNCAETSAPIVKQPRACPEEMVNVASRFCIDRYEATMVETSSGLAFSPFYPADYEEMRKAVVGQVWGLASLGKETLRPPVPPLPEWQRSPNAKPRAVSRAGVVPQGYLSKPTAKAACEAAGKRLCRIDEWKTACRGEQNTRFPYGKKYEERVCNVHEPQHPAAILYGDASLGHWDPRLNQLPVRGAPLLKPTGATTTCKSTWGDDGVYDMVGNIDEWVDDAKGTFVGGFYARDTVRGCDARVSEHIPVFFDFSTGVRCCVDLRGDAAQAEEKP
jgi:hypothetical protein